MNELENKCQIILDDLNKSISWLVNNIDNLVKAGAPIDATKFKSNIDFRCAVTMVYLCGLDKKFHKSNVSLDIIITLLDKGVFNEYELDKIVQNMSYLSMISPR